jgi:hypothetical protein
MKKPKKPIHPTHPYKLTAPSKTIEFPRYRSLDDQTISISNIIKMLPNNYPLEKANIINSYEDECDDGGSSLEYFESISNDSFDLEMKSYARKQKLYDKKMIKYQTEMAIYLKEKKAFSAWFKVEDRRRKIAKAKEDFEQASKKLRKLKVNYNE